MELNEWTNILKQAYIICSCPPLLVILLHVYVFCRAEQAIIDIVETCEASDDVYFIAGLRQAVNALDKVGCLGDAPFNDPGEILNMISSYSQLQEYLRAFSYGVRITKVPLLVSVGVVPAPRG